MKMAQKEWGLSPRVATLNLAPESNPSEKYFFNPDSHCTDATMVQIFFLGPNWTFCWKGVQKWSQFCAKVRIFNWIQKWIYNSSSKQNIYNLIQSQKETH